MIFCALTTAEVQADFMNSMAINDYKVIIESSSGIEALFTGEMT